MHARELAEPLGVPETALNFKQLEMLKKHCKYVEKQPSYIAAVASSSKIKEVKEDHGHLALLKCMK